MISLGTMRNEYERAKKILKKFEIEYEENYDKVLKKFSDSCSPEFRKQTLVGSSLDIYNTAIDYKDFNLFLPADGAILQFSFDTSTLRFAYFERPHNAMSYKEFLLSLDFSYEEVGDFFYEDFNQYLLESPQKDHVTNIRYDYSESEYQELVHPVSHLHIGQENNIRLPLSVVLLPSSFVMLIIKQVYWKKFKKCLEKDESLVDYYIQQINIVKKIDKDFFSQIDANDLSLNKSQRVQ